MANKRKRSSYTLIIRLVFLITVLNTALIIYVSKTEYTIMGRGSADIHGVPLQAALFTTGAAIEPQILPNSTPFIGRTGAYCVDMQSRTTCFGNFSLGDVESKLDYLDLLSGGRWTCPKTVNNTSVTPVALLIPYRDRKRNLIDFLSYIIPYFIRACQSFHIFIINQIGLEAFNRGGLLNAGYLMAKEYYPELRCFAFHDVDKVPVYSARYTCGDHMHQLYTQAFGINRQKQYSVTLKYAYSGFLGGVSLVSDEVMETINGFTNVMFGWGGEDDNLFQRLMETNTSVVYSNNTRYFCLLHGHDRTNFNIKRSIAFSRALATLYQHDGLSTTNFRLISIVQHKLYTNITVEIPGPRFPRDFHYYLASTVTKIIQDVPDLRIRNQLNSSLYEYLYTAKWQKYYKPPNSTEEENVLFRFFDKLM